MKKLGEHVYIYYLMMISWWSYQLMGICSICLQTTERSHHHLHNALKHTMVITGLAWDKSQQIDQNKLFGTTCIVW